MKTRLLAEGPGGRLEIHVRPSGRVPFEEFKAEAETKLWDRMQRSFDRFVHEGLGIVDSLSFKPLNGRGKGIWEFKEFDHRLYAFRGPDYGKAVRMVLLNGWVKDKDPRSGGTMEEARRIEKAIAYREECIQDVEWDEAPPEPDLLPDPEPDVEEDATGGEDDEEQEASNEKPGYLDIVAVAGLLGVQRKRLRRWIERGQIVPDLVEGSGAWWHEGSVDALRERVEKLRPVAKQPEPEVLFTDPDPDPDPDPASPVENLVHTAWACLADYEEAQRVERQAAEKAEAARQRWLEAAEALARHMVEEYDESREET